MTIKERDEEILRLKKIAKKGGKATAKKHGSEHMSEIGKKGGKNRWRIDAR